MNSNFQVFSQVTSILDRTKAASSYMSSSSNQQQNIRLKIEKIILIAFTLFVVLGILSGILSLIMLNIVSVSFPLFIVSEVLIGIGLIGLAIYKIYKTNHVFRKTLGKTVSEDKEVSSRYRLLKNNDIAKFYSEIISPKDITSYNIEVAKNFYFHENYYAGSPESFLSSLYVETYYLFHRIFPQESEDSINQKVADFLRSLTLLELSDQVNFLSSLISDSTLGLELAYLLGGDAEFSCSALAYVLENIFIKGIYSSRKEEFQEILISLSSRVMSLWNQPNWEESSTPYVVRMILLAAKQDVNLNKKISSNLPLINATFWQSILRSKNKQAMQTFLFEYGVLDCNENNDSALMVAVKEGLFDLIPFLLDQGCENVIEAKNNQGLNIISLLEDSFLESAEVENIITVIIEKALSVKELTKDFQFNLLITSLKLDLKLPFFEKLAQLNIDIWAYNEFKETLFSYAFSKNRFDIAKWCLKNNRTEFSELFTNIFDNKSLLKSFLDPSVFDKDLFKLMLFQGLSLDISLTKSGGNLLLYFASEGRLDILIDILQLFRSNENTSPLSEEENYLKQQVEQAINSLDLRGNSILHCLSSSQSLDLSSDLIEDFLVLLITSYSFNRLGALNREKRTALVSSMVNRRFLLASLLLNFMSFTDINAGSTGSSIYEHSHPFFLWMMYYVNETGSEDVMEKIIRKGLNLNLLLIPSRKTIKDICIEWNLSKIISFLKKINVWEGMRTAREL